MVQAIKLLTFDGFGALFSSFFFLDLSLPSIGSSLIVFPKNFTNYIYERSKLDRWIYLQRWSNMLYESLCAVLFGWNYLDRVFTNDRRAPKMSIAYRPFHWNCVVIESLRKKVHPKYWPIMIFYPILPFFHSSKWNSKQRVSFTISSLISVLRSF